MTLTGDAKFKGKLTRGLKNDVTNLVNFQRAVESLKILALMASFVQSI